MRSASSGPAPRKITIEKDKLSLFEQKEIQNFPDVLFVGTSTRKIKLSTTNNFGKKKKKHLNFLFHSIFLKNYLIL